MSARSRFVLTRTALAVPTLVAMSIFVFLIIRLVPGDPVRTMLGFRATPENVKTVRHALGLDHSLAYQYGHWATGLLHGDLGQDYISHVSVAELLGQRIPVTLELTLLSLALGLAAGVPLGIVSARGGQVARMFTSSFTVAGISIPDFWLGTLLILVFAAKLGWLPPTGYTSFATDPIENLRSMALPVLTLAIGEAAYILRTTRASMQETLGRPFVSFLRAKGLSERSIVYRHALRTASLPIITVVSIQFGVLLGGAIVVETVFGLPGVGKLVVTAINQRNYTVVQGSVLVIAALFIVVNLLTDLVYGYLNPRLEAGAA